MISNISIEYSIFIKSSHFPMWKIWNNFLLCYKYVPTYLPTIKVNKLMTPDFVAIQNQITLQKQNEFRPLPIALISTSILNYKYYYHLNILNRFYNGLLHARLQWYHWKCMLQQISGVMTNHLIKEMEIINYIIEKNGFPDTQQLGK